MLLQESSTAHSSTSPPRNLSLNLTQVATTRLPLKASNGGSSSAAADTCDERTRLLGARTPPRTRRQNSENNNSFTTSNNNNDNEISSATAAAAAIAQNANASGSGGGDAMCEDDALSEEADVTVTADSDASEKQLPRQTTKKQKLSKLGNKSVGLKRVSFGSSKGSMVETLVFETPTPLAEHAEPTFGFECDPIYKAATNYNTYTKTNMDDSGIEVQEESERSIVRVSIYQSSQPQQICPPENYTKFEDNLDNSFSSYNNYNLDDVMTTVSTIPGYDRQQSTDSGWDNPFRPGGDLSREAEEIVNMIKGGKPITPTEDHSLINGKTQREDNCNGTAVEHVTKSNLTQTQSAQNGTNSHRAQTTTTTSSTTGATTTTVVKQPENNGVTSLAQVSKQVVPGPTSASHVVIDEKKNKKKGCCTIQ